MTGIKISLAAKIRRLLEQANAVGGNWQDLTYQAYQNYIAAGGKNFRMLEVVK